MPQSNHLNLAAQILGVSVHASPSEIKYAFYRLMCQHHPDKHQGDPQAGQRSALINEARNMLLGRTLNPTLLRDKTLVSEVLEHPPVSESEDDEKILSYNEWLKAQFFNVQEGSIWP
ncbi:MAG: J domain-containing protein [Desulfovermiculus sp.]